MGKIFLEIYFVGSFMVFFSNKEKCGATYSTKCKFFLAASNFLKNDFEHNLCLQQGKYICMGKSFLNRYFDGSFLVIFFKQEKSMGANSLQNSSFSLPPQTS